MNNDTVIYLSISTNAYSPKSCSFDEDVISLFTYSAF